MRQKTHGRRGLVLAADLLQEPPRAREQRREVSQNIGCQLRYVAAADGLALPNAVEQRQRLLGACSHVLFVSIGW